MNASIKGFIGDKTVVAVTYRQPLEPVEGWDAPLNPPTYAARRGKGARSEYVINEIGEGIRICELDTLQSQANRMEASYRAALADLIPRHAVEAGEKRMDLTALGHRLADASVRATALAGDIRASFESFDAGDPVPLARLAPTSLVYGAWDSRDTRVRVRRVIASRIEARDVVECVRSAQYAAVFGQGELGFTDSEWKKGSEAGFAPSPATGRPGGIRVRGGIGQSAAIMLDVLRGYRPRGGAGVLPVYLLGLALGGLLVGGRRYDLRSGCALVPAGPATWQVVRAGGERCPVEVAAAAVLEELRELAREWSEATGVELGGEPRVHRFDRSAAKRMLKAKPPRSA